MLFKQDFMLGNPSVSVEHKRVAVQCEEIHDCHEKLN